MDVALYLRVLWRFRVLVAAGLLLTLVLALLSFVRIGFDGGKPMLEYRSDQTWASRSTLLVTQVGFPWGRAVLDQGAAPAGKRAAGPTYPDPGRFTSLAMLYATFVESDEVRAILLRSGAVNGAYGAEAARSPDGTTYLPLVRITALSNAPEAAMELARRVTHAFRTYLAQEQLANRIPADQRAEVPVVSRPMKAELYKDRSKSRPVLILFLGFTLTCALAFVLESRRPRVSNSVISSPQLSVPPEARRAARTG